MEKQRGSKEEEEKSKENEEAEGRSVFLSVPSMRADSIQFLLLA